MDAERFLKSFSLTYKEKGIELEFEKEEKQDG